MSSTMKIDEDGNRIWRNGWKNLHREDGPAVEHEDGYKAYYRDGRRHRIEGPAVQLEHCKQWWVYDKCISDLVRELLRNSPFGEDVHLGILAEYFAERGDFRLLDIIQPYLTESK